MLSLAITALAWNPGSAQDGSTITVLGEAQMASPPAAPVNVRVSEGLFQTSAPPLTHSHGAGWVYVIQGTHILMMAGRTETFQPGQAVWTPAGIAHTHDWDRTQAHRFLFIGTATNQPSAVPSGFRLFGLTDPLEGLTGRPYVVRLARVTLQPGVQTAIVKVVTPQVLVGLAGTPSILAMTGIRAIPPEQVLLMQAGSAYQLRNPSSAPGSVLLQSLIESE